MRTIIFYGDSNTYGFDPAFGSPGRYPAEGRWPDILAERLEGRWNVIPHGLNGRRIPDVTMDHDYVQMLIRQTGQDGVFAVMLGTNDLLNCGIPNADGAIARMDRLLGYAAGEMAPERILLIAPGYDQTPPAADPIMERYPAESRRMVQAFRSLAAKYRTAFADANDFGIELAFDHVHFTMPGNCRFAACMEEYLLESFPN